MIRNHFRTLTIGVTAGAITGVVTVAGIIAWDEHDPWGMLCHAVARRRLSPAERWELDRLRAEQANQRSADARVRDLQTATTRAKFRPDLLAVGIKASTLEELPIPALIFEVLRASELSRSADGTMPATTRDMWWNQRNALLDEFDQRRGWDVKRHLSELDQLRLDSAQKKVALHRYTLPPAAASPDLDPFGDPADDYFNASGPY
ncbi:hypothetical protein H0264_14510 [Nocardia huaxiensis]|uniref:Uncharacterized protein n=1 Tax=Nocardia huaxiensis TaxID=2755382 RepID=A0A7D6ZML5_9NOCA|nr:hypothetical protein [Nocardia huaxiensis]QLY33280.1 hypothetical protein H0264_14510 [Nocardia huaxiensis]